MFSLLLGDGGTGESGMGKAQRCKDGKTANTLNECSPQEVFGMRLTQC